jgi:O-antigen ligase/tetratricopeptide (TPR) repeat protein
MSPKTYLRILQGGIIASLIIMLFVFKDLLFPYITSKQLPFNIIMEFLFALWLVFMLRYPEYRPKKSLISIGLVAYFLAILISCFFSVDYNLSFWGNAERMLGFFHLVHFLIFYFIIITVFRSWKEWKWLLMSSVVVATFVSLIGLFGANPYSTIGNTAYVSGYLIFSIYFIVLLFFRSDHKNARWLYLLPLIIMLIEFKNMHTSGAIIGLAASILLMFLLLGLSHNSKAIRRGSLVVFAIAVIAIIGVFSQMNSPWFQKSFLKNLTFEKVTFQTRLISWSGAAKDFKNHPIIGTGFGNYAIIFDKYFDSKFYDYSTTDTYFDRAHNNLIDITSTTGLVGLITYLSIFLAAFYYLGKEFKLNGKRTGSDANGLNNIEIIVIISLITAYFIQNLVIFDSFTTLIGLMITLGFIYWLDWRRGSEEISEREPRFVIKKEGTELICLIVFLLAAFIFANHYNIKTWKMFVGSIDGYSEISAGNLETGVAIYKENFSGKPMERDARITLINLVASNPSLLSNLSTQKALDILDYVISLAQLNVSENPNDSLKQMQLAQVLDTAARYSYSPTSLERFNFYSTQAMQAIQASIDASPGRATTYFIKAQMQLFRNENDDAVATMKQAIALNTNYSEGYCRLAQMYFIIKDSKYDNEISNTMNSCIDKGGASNISSVNFLKLGINYYLGTKDYSRAITVLNQLLSVAQPDSETYLVQANLYYDLGNINGAKAAMQNALAIDRTLASNKDFTDLMMLVNSNSSSSSGKVK